MDVIYLVYSIVGGILAGGLAKEKGRCLFTWLILGIFFTIPSIIIVILLSPMPGFTKEDFAIKRGELFRCYNCQEVIRVGAKICRYCGSGVEDE